jgi:hypothetical protein
METNSPAPCWSVLERLILTSRPLSRFLEVLDVKGDELRTSQRASEAEKEPTRRREVREGRLASRR